MSLVDPLVLHLIGSHPKLSPVILRHLQFAGFLDHILEIAETHDEFIALVVQQGRVLTRTPQQESTLDLRNG